MRDAFVTGWSTIVPGLEDRRLLEAFDRADPVRSTECFDTGAVRVEATRPDLDQVEELPRGRRARVMRRDVAMAVAAVERLLSDTPEERHDWLETGLFIGTGVGQDDKLEEQVRDLWESYVELEDRAPAERNAALFRAVPPLMAVSGLSNSSASFIAKEFGIRGPNAVFGVTSHSGYQAVAEGVHAVRLGQTDRAVVGGSNAVGPFSALALSVLAAEESVGREAEATVFLLIEAAESAAASGRRLLSRVSPVIRLDDVATGDVAAVLTGGSPFVEQQRAVEAAWTENGRSPRSWYRRIGCSGAASMPLHAATAALLVASGIGSVLCVNADPYRRCGGLLLEPTVN